MKAPFFVALLLLCSAQTPQTDSLIHFADGSTLRCTKYEAKNDLLVIYTADGNQFTIRKSNVTKIEPVLAKAKKEENKMKVIETGVPRKTGPSLAEASALCGNAKGGFTVLEDNGSQAPVAREDARESTEPMHPTNRGVSRGGTRLAPGKSSKNERSRLSNIGAGIGGNNSRTIEDVKRNIFLENCRIERRVDSVPIPTTDPIRPIPQGSVWRYEKHRSYRIIGMIRNGTGENLCDVSATIVSDFKEIRPITVRLAVLNPYEARQFVQEIGAGEQFSAAFRIDRVTCRVCTPAQLDKEVKSLPQGKPPADDPKSTGSTPLFPK